MCIRDRNKTYTVCDANFFDTGGPNANYTDNENSAITFYPGISTKKLTAIVNNLDIEDGGTNCINDRLMVYDGTSIMDNLVATLCGTNIPDHIIASNPSGALTFQFISNSTVLGAGWDITLSCDSNVGISEKFKNNIKIYPNPATSGRMVIETENPMQQVVVRDGTGRIVSSFVPHTNRYILECNWPSGIYLLQIEMNNKWIGRKIQIIR
jgi:hypothetical protein